MADTYAKLTITGLTSPQQLAMRDAFNANVDRTNIKVYSLFWDNSGNLSIEAGGPDVNTALTTLNNRVNQLIGRRGSTVTLELGTTKMRTPGDTKVRR